MTSIHIPPDFGQFTWTFYTGGQSRPSSFAVGFHYTGFDMDPADLRDALIAATENLLPLMAETTHIDQCTTLIGPTGGGDPVIIVSQLGLYGTSTQHSEPPQIAVLVQKRTGRTGRHNRGRMYLPPPLEIDVNAGGGLQTVGDWQENIVAFQTALESLDICDLLAVLHDDASLDPVAILPPGQGLLVSGVIATQRKRLKRGA